MATNSAEKSLEERLNDEHYDRDACLAALRGEKVPRALGRELHRLCVIRGIRYHHGFGNELRGVLPAFNRALNARCIMSNVVPDMSASEEFPYCIWYPECGSEAIYREVAKRYPHMAYQVGRACAVAGYSELYQELDILPDVHIAEEARECGNFAIYDLIMAAPIRYSIMNDYSCKIELDSDRSHKPAFLNGDTAVRWMLDIKQKIGIVDDDLFFGSSGYDDTMFNITEDMNIDEHGSDEHIINGHESETRHTKRLSTRLEVQLLHEPLPADLPTVQKDLLIVMAAYYGDIDRYVRLRRPKFVYNELLCCVRGIYHNTPFAVWWSKQTGPRSWHIEKAINARFIMNNVLSQAPYSRLNTPYLIWLPTTAYSSTYRHLAKIQPEMLPQIVHACIHAGYKELFDELLPKMTPNDNLIEAAKLKGDTHYRHAIEQRMIVLGTKREDGQSQYDEYHHYRHIATSMTTSSADVLKYVDANTVSTSWYSPYNGRSCDASDIDTLICVPDEWKRAAFECFATQRMDYVDFPPSALLGEEEEEEMMPSSPMDDV